MRVTGRLATVASLVLMSSAMVRAQLVVTDPAVTLRDAAIAATTQQIFDALTQEAEQITKMAKRLSALTDVHKYAIAHADTPKWRIHTFQGEQFLYANPYDAALNYGDSTGHGFEQVARSRVDAAHALAAIAEAGDAEPAVLAQLATLDAADSTLITGTDQTGHLRYNGRQELAAIDALQHDALEGSSSQSATAVLDTISGATLVRARQQQARLQFLTAVVEQLLVDNKRARDTEAATMNMQLERLRSGPAANHAVIAGATDALRSWRQP